ncbi:MAG: hypothetical protein M3Y33_11415 [Actinomycetota bacterium]|nr:hypothetical protein [Actinomycetota bacterium]
MLRSGHPDRRRPGITRSFRRLGEAALAAGSGYQRNREAVEPALRVGIDLLALLALVARRRTPSTAGTVSVLPSDWAAGDSVASGATR